MTFYFEGGGIMSYDIEFQFSLYLLSIFWRLNTLLVTLHLFSQCKDQSCVPGDVGHMTC